MSQIEVSLAEVRRLYRVAFKKDLPVNLSYKEGGRRAYSKLGREQFLFALGLIRSKVEIDVEDEEETGLEPEEILEEAES